MSKFSLTLTPFNQIANLMRLNMPYTFNEVLLELEKEEWESGRHDMYNWPDGKRHKLIRPKSILLQEIFNYLSSAEPKISIINALYEHIPQCYERWRWTKDQMIRNTTLHAEFTRDLPGFYQGVHMDTKILVATSMVYLTENNDPDVATYFHSNELGDNPIQAPTDFGNGWSHLNDWNSWHSGRNYSDKPRYTILVPLTLAKTLSW